MSETIGTAQIEVTGDARGFDSTVKQAKKSLADLGATASKTGKDTASGMGQAGAATDKLDAATKRAAASIERQALALGKSKAEYYAAKAAIDGNSAALAPYIAKLREAEANVSATAKAQKGLSESSALTARAFGAIAAGLSVAKLVQMADAVTRLQNQLKLAAGSTAGAAAAYEALFDIAQRSRVSFTELGSVYASVARAGATLGVSQGRLLKVTESIGNALTISGGSAASMQAALVQLSQGLASGTLRGEELNSVMEQTPRLAKALADGLGVSIGELREMGKAGQLTSETVIQALESQATALASEVRNATLSVGQAFTVLQNSATKFVGDADKATGASATLAGALMSVSKGIDSVGKSLSENGTLITTVLGGVAGAGALAGLGAVASNLGKIRVAVLALSAALTANPITLALLGIGAAVGGFVAYNSAASKTVDGLKRTIAELESINKMGPSIYGRDAESMKAWNAAVDKRNAQIRELREQIALLDNQQLDTRAEDARLAASTRSFKANEQLAESMEGIRLRVAGVNKDYTQFYADLAVYQKARESGMVTEQEYVALVSQLSIEYAKGTKATKENKDAEKERWADIKKRRQEQVDDTNFYLAGLQILAKEEAATAAAVAKAYTASMEKQDAYTASLREQVARQLEQNAAIGLTADELVKLEVARLNDAAATLEQNAALNEQMGDMSDLSAKYREQAAELRKLAAAKAEGGAKQANVDAADVAGEAAKQATEDWKRAAAEIENDITDALMRGFESGKGFAENLRDVVVNMFKTMVLRPIIQATVQGGLSAVGLGGPAGGGSGLLGNAASAASLYNQLSTGTGLIGSVLASNAAYGAAIGSTAIGAGSQAAMLAAQTGSFGAAGVAATSQAAAGAGAGASSVLGAIPGWGWALGGLALLAGSGFGKTPGEQTRGGYYSSSGKGATLENAMAVTGGGGWDDGAWARDLIDREDAGLKNFTQQTVDGVLSATQSRAKALGMDIALGIDAGFAANLNGKAKDGNAFGYAQIFSNGELAGEYSNRELGSDVTAAGAKFAGELADAAAKVVLAGTDFGRTGETASATLMRLGDSLTAANGIFDTLGTTLFDVSLAGGDMASQLTDTFGSLDALTAAASSYYEAFYSDAERAATTTRQVSEALADLGLAMPASRDAFRDLVEAQDLTTESGRKTYAALLQLAPAFSSVTDSVAAQRDAMVREAGISGDNIAQALRDGLLGRMSGVEVGAAISEMVIGGIYNGLANNASASISQMFVDTIVAPMLTAVTAGGNIATAVSASSINAVVQAASAAAAQIAAVMNDPAFKAAMAQINTAIGGISAGVTSAYRPATPVSQPVYRSRDSGESAAERARQKWQNAFDVLSRTLDVQRDLAQQQLEAASAVYDLSRDAARSLRGEVDSVRRQTAQEGERFIEQALSSLRITGYLPEAEGLSEAIAAAREGLASRNYTSRFDQQREQLILAGKLQQIADLAGPQKTAAEQQLEYLNGLLDTAQRQLDTLNGVKDANLSLADALKYWAAQTGKPLNVAAMVSSSSPPTPNVFAASPPPVTYLMQSGSGNAEMVAELRALRVESAALRERLDRIDLSTSATSRSTERAALVLDDAARGKQALSTVTT